MINNIAVLTAAVSALSMATIAIAAIVYMLNEREKNSILKTKLKNANIHIRMNVLSEMSHKRRLWFIETFCHKDKALWRKAMNIIEKN